jgi:hypothetical protein
LLFLDLNSVVKFLPVDNTNILMCFILNIHPPQSKDIKRACLSELYDYVKCNHGIFTEANHGEFIAMFMANAFRVLSPPSQINGADFDPEEDEPVLEPSWGHLQVPLTCSSLTLSLAVSQISLTTFEAVIYGCF